MMKRNLFDGLGDAFSILDAVITVIGIIILIIVGKAAGLDYFGLFIGLLFLVIIVVSIGKAFQKNEKRMNDE